MKKTLYKPETEDVSVNLYVNEVCGFIDFGCNTNCPRCNDWC
jgi:hypothetical protein